MQDGWVDRIDLMKVEEIGVDGWISALWFMGHWVHE